MPTAARSRSARAVTTHAFLPPISVMQGRGQAPLVVFRSSPRPTSYEPVKVSPARCSWDTSASPTTLPLPVR